MPGGDGTGRGSGGGQGRGGGFSQGPGGVCVCRKCKTEIPHAPGQPCHQRVCPNCGFKMTRKMDS